MDSKEYDDNTTSQKDELEVLESIYGKDFVIEDEFCPTIGIVIRMTNDEKYDSYLVVSFNSNYPSTEPPVFLLSVPWIHRDEKQKLDKSLHEKYVEHKGDSIVYIWVEHLRELLTKRHCLLEEQLQISQSISELQEIPTFEEVTDVLLPEIFTGEPLTDRKSTFQAHVAQITQIRQIRLVLDELRKNKKIASATHNMYAYRIFHSENKCWQQDCDDDGETHAGGRLLHLLQILNCSNVLVVVTRWYGGVMLYGDRFKHINNVARQILEKQGYLGASSPAKIK